MVPELERAGRSEPAEMPPLQEQAEKAGPLEMWQ